MEYNFFNNIDVFISFEDPVIFLGSHRMEISKTLMSVNLHNIDLIEYFEKFSIDNYSGNIQYDKNLNVLKYKNIILWDGKLLFNRRLDLKESVRELIVFKNQFEQFCFENKEKQSDIEYELKLFYKHIISNSTETIRWLGERNG